MTERRRFVAVMRPPGGTLVALAIERTARHKAFEDIARAIGPYLEKRTSAGVSTAGSAGEWAAWALRLPRRMSIPAPDGSVWSVTTRIDFV